MKKKFAIVFLSLFLVVSLPFAAHANIVTATGKYIINVVKKLPGATRVEATNTATGAKHVINHGVSSSALATGIAAGVIQFGVSGGLGLAFQAITGLALDAVDWVMDPDNNQIKWKKKGEGGAGSSNLPYVWDLSDSDLKFPSADAACRYKFTNYQGGKYVFSRVNFLSPVYANCWIKKVRPDGSFEPEFNSGAVSKEVPNPSYDPSLPSDSYKLVPLVDLAKKVLDLADSGNPAAQKAVEDYVTNLAKEGKLDTELDNAPDITQPENPDITQPENPEEPNPEEPQECPSGTVKLDNVCVKIPDSDSDEPLFCDSSEFTKKVCDWIDWTQKPHDKPDSGNVDIIDKSEGLNIDQNRIDFTNQCPAPTPINISVGGFPVSTELNYQPLCDFFIMLNPFVIGMGGISSALIIAGGARRG